MSHTMSFNPNKQFQGLFLPAFLVRRRELSSDAKLLYAQMSLMIGESRELFISYDLLSDEIGLAIHELKSAYEELEYYSLIKTKTHAAGRSSCTFVFADMLYGSQRVAREGQSISKAVEGINEIESFLNPGFERLFSTYRLKNRDYCGNRRDAYKAFQKLGGTFDSAVLLESAKQYLDDPRNTLKVGLYTFINDRIFLNYLPTTLIYISDAEEEISGEYDRDTHLFRTLEGEIVGELSPERMIELLQSGRLKVQI